MGYRLHVARKYDVEYGNIEAFNHKCEEFHDLLTACGAKFTGESNDELFEVSRADWTDNLIGKLKMLDDLEVEEQEEILDAISCLETTPEEIVDIAEKLIAEADPNHNYLVLNYF